MKLFYLEHIIETLLENVPCPSCKAFLEDELVEIKGIKKNQAELFVPCPYCGAQIVIMANVEEKSEETVVKVYAPSKKQQEPHLSRENVQNIIHSIKTFKEGDIRKLFSEK